MSDPTPQPGPGNTPIQLPLLCFNDVYRVTQRYVPQPGAPPFDTAAVSKGTGEAAKITVAQFGRLVQDLREQWAPRPAAAKGAEGGSGSEKAKDVVNGDKEDEGQKQEKREGLTLFAGDVFNPTVQSKVTRGSHMVPVLNMLGIDVACIGNHDFDFGASPDSTSGWARVKHMTRSGGQLVRARHGQILTCYSRADIQVILT